MISYFGKKRNIIGDAPIFHRQICNIIPSFSYEQKTANKSFGIEQLFLKCFRLQNLI